MMGGEMDVSADRLTHQMKDERSLRAGTHFTLTGATKLILRFTRDDRLPKICC